MSMQFVTGRGASEIKQANLSGPLPEYRDLRYVEARIANGKAHVFGARFWSRVYSDLIRPADLLIMIQELIDGVAKYESSVE